MIGLFTTAVVLFSQVYAHPSVAIYEEKMLQAQGYRNWAREWKKKRCPTKPPCEKISKKEDKIRCENRQKLGQSYCTSISKCDVTHKKATDLCMGRIYKARDQIKYSEGGIQNMVQCF